MIFKKEKPEGFVCKTVLSFVLGLIFSLFAFLSVAERGSWGGARAPAGRPLLGGGEQEGGRREWPGGIPSPGTSGSTGLLSAVLPPLPIPAGQPGRLWVRTAGGGGCSSSIAGGPVASFCHSLVSFPHFCEH